VWDVCFRGCTERWTFYLYGSTRADGPVNSNAVRIYPRTVVRLPEDLVRTLLASIAAERANV